MGKGSVSQAGQGAVGAGPKGGSAPSKVSKRVAAPRGSNVSAAAVGKQGPSIGGSGLIRFGFSDDSPGLKVGPIAVLVIALVYLVSVILLHLLGKLRS
eukprot:CAMPEP_0184349628 /NCGR_PEP_ID=MMETSP1089-20130417/35502_1 /TAXON_ID=38269 ORGANISM="Gloeochaete wittrockiana, Strain SAG46.84" /NCGR_SAMPLE_ID=MMETSP1089 /ASSEMBLY_ACC=CAM_ASM_000445 /LENGTH=97 /DNA_ID=CAMNT_0026681983 /DNA_START=35 /DNA_END=328 /DNA_ORIENTATION=+